MPVVEVIARLGAPVVVTDALHLDGILSGVHPDTVGGHLHRGADPSEIIRPRLPVVSRSLYGEEVYLCSAEEWPAEARRRSGYLTRKRDGDDLDYLTQPIQTASGPGRDVLLRYPVVEAPWVRWVAVGSRRGILTLIRRAEAVGAIRRHGHGAVLAGAGDVLGWEVRRLDMPALEVLVAGGLARRHLPAAWCDTPAAVDVGALRHPYWHRASYGPRVRRGTPTRLLPEVAAMIQSAT